MPTYSSRGTSFSAECGAGGAFGISVFLREGDEVYRTYFTTARGADQRLGCLTPPRSRPVRRGGSGEDLGPRLIHSVGQRSAVTAVVDHEVSPGQTVVA